MIRKIFKIVSYLLLVVFIIGTLAFTSSRTENVICREIEVDFEKDEIIKIDKSEIIRMVKSADNKLLSKNFDQINTDAIEAEVEKHQAILKAEVYEVVTKDSSSFRGVLVVDVKHREPIVRIMSESGSYYLDKLGGKIPISTNYTANVLVVTGYLSEDFAKNKLLPFVQYIEQDEFWKAQIEQVHVEKNGEILLTPLVGEHIIELGKIVEYETKLKKMKAFYKQVLAQNNWNKYKTISLKYNNQVIAKKR